MAVLVFFAWLGVAALVSWLTAFQMPDGFGNAIFGMQLVGGLVSAGLMAMGLPTAIDPSTQVVVSSPGGGPNRYVTWPRPNPKSAGTLASSGDARSGTPLAGSAMGNRLSIPRLSVTGPPSHNATWEPDPFQWTSQSLSGPAVNDCRSIVAGNGGLKIARLLLSCGSRVSPQRKRSDKAADNDAGNAAYDAHERGCS